MEWSGWMAAACPTRPWGFEMSPIKASCAHCRNIRAAKTMPYCCVPVDGALVRLVEDGGGWKTQGGERLNECRAFDEKRKRNRDDTARNQCFLPGTETLMRERLF